MTERAGATRASSAEPPLAGGTPLVDVHAHFLHAGCGRTDWEARNASRLAAGERIGITVHVASILGSFGHTSPTYFPSPDDLRVANDAMLDLQRRHPDRVRSYVTVNPNEPAHAREEIARCIGRPPGEGAIGIKLAASRRANDPLVDPVAEEAARHRVPILHHIWQHRRREWPGQEASDAIELGALAARHPQVAFILAHIGGGGDWAHTLPAVEDLPNVYLDLSGSGVDRGMLDAAARAVGAARLLWGCDLTMETGLAKLRALSAAGLDDAAVAQVRWRNAASIFGSHALPGIVPEAEPRARAADAAT
ncbi:MAG TPA: amidohydrolase family protein [Gemmatimonadaceae bacterium]|nr:amidohydrolase family protein [Gemmatimonadaceae bacterium]